MSHKFMNHERIERNFSLSVLYEIFLRVDVELFLIMLYQLKLSLVQKEQLIDAMCLAMALLSVCQL